MVPSSEIHLSNDGSVGGRGIVMWVCSDIDLIIGCVGQLELCFIV